jgi:hypothetical protein
MLGTPHFEPSLFYENSKHVSYWLKLKLFPRKTLVLAFLFFGDHVYVAHVSSRCLVDDFDIVVKRL